MGEKKEAQQMGTWLVTPLRSGKVEWAVKMQERGCGGRVAVVLSGSKKKDTVQRKMLLEGLIILFIWLFWVLVAACGIFSLRCGMWDLVPDQDGTRSPCIGSMES